MIYCAVLICITGYYCKCRLVWTYIETSCDVYLHCLYVLQSRFFDFHANIIWSTSKIFSTVVYINQQNSNDLIFELYCNFISLLLKGGSLLFLLDFGFRLMFDLHGDFNFCFHISNSKFLLSWICDLSSDRRPPDD